VSHVKKAAESVPGVESCDVNLAGGSAVVHFKSSEIDPGRIANAITAAGYDAQVRNDSADRTSSEMARLEKQTHEANAWFRRTIIGTVLWLPLEALHWIGELSGGSHTIHAAQHGWMGWAAMLCATLSIFYVGKAFYV